MKALVVEKLTAVSTSSRSHRRLAKFVDWIKPEAATAAIIRDQAATIRRAIGGQAEADGLKVTAMPEAGSFAKNTGLRRHMRGDSEIEGHDVDLPFVVKPQTEESERINELLHRFDRYAGASYPRTPRTITGSSVELRFIETKLNYDLVPMLQAATPGYQVILKKDGTRRVTSVARHTEFIGRRTHASDELAGRVKFNECVRLLKWWRYVRIGTASPIEEVRTTLIELMCASAYDRLEVGRTYTETLAAWFRYLASVVKNRTPISFDDYPSVEPYRKDAPGSPLWEVIDPVNCNNNVVHTVWGNIELDEFAQWFADSRDAFARIVSNESMGNDSAVDDLLADLFGNAILAHGELT
jgi:hypothetical protein